MSIEEELTDMIVEKLEVAREAVEPEASFIDDLGADSLEIVELVLAMEEKFEIEIPDEDSEKIQKVSDAIHYVKEKLGS